MHIEIESELIILNSNIKTKKSMRLSWNNVCVLIQYSFKCWGPSFLKNTVLSCQNQNIKILFSFLWPHYWLYTEKKRRAQEHCSWIQHPDNPFSFKKPFIRITFLFYIPLLDPFFFLQHLSIILFLPFIVFIFRTPLQSEPAPASWPFLSLEDIH